MSIRKWSITLKAQEQYVEVEAATEDAAINKAYDEAEGPSWDASEVHEICPVCSEEMTLRCDDCDPEDDN